EDISQELSNNEIEVISPSSKLPTAQYLAIHDENGTMDVAICDASINSVMTIDFVEEHIEKLKEVEYVLIETNLEEKFIVDLVDTLKDKKIVVEGVSLAKVVKLKKILDKVYLFKSNMKEAMEITSKNNEEDAIHSLIDLGVKNFVISNGKEDVIVYSSSKLTRIKVTHLDNIVNETGAGDALISGIMSSLNRGKSLVDSVKDGILLSNKVLLISSSHLSKKDL
ncbi:MAG: PfkB family carbohydrate kinase, partial [Bacilli bacterium]|nr:PfkB family carbohydrate kinase [Bacilli bacterium]